MINVISLNKTFDFQNVLKDISMEVYDGEIRVILGESGSGKSVLLKHLVGLLRPDSGSVEIDSVNVTRLSERQLLTLRKGIGYLFQEGALFDSMDVFENIAFPLEEHTSLNDREIEEKVRHILKMVGLQDADRKFPTQLSGGMKKRAALARSVILDPKMLFCDEPTSGLDPIKSREITDLIRDISRELKTTTVVTSHDIENSFRIADRITLIHQGRLLVTGTKQDIQSSVDPFVQSFFAKTGGLHG